MTGVAELAACKVLKVAAHEIEGDLADLAGILPDPDDGHVVWVSSRDSRAARNIFRASTAASYPRGSFRCARTSQ